MITVAEPPEYIRRAQKLLSAEEWRDVVEYLATHPKTGNLIEGTGGLRKLCWGRGDRTQHGPALILLNLIERAPKAVMRALA